MTCTNSRRTLPSFQTPKQTAKQRAQDSPIGIFRAHLAKLELQDQFKEAEVRFDKIVRLKRKKPIRRASKKRTKELREYSKRRKHFLGLWPICQATAIIWPNLLSPASQEIHHMRGKIGVLLNDERYWLAVCREAHNWIHSHPSESRKLGLLK